MKTNKNLFDSQINLEKNILIKIKTLFVVKEHL